ncbi:hypothetical protein I7I50_11443 [Histoplasma capsulatum G186AR]|uniref:Uncharacterized protein n=1 Tax=Ajellomyces capsulatus TaxID=5037 RepID=A0A8H8D998_AJECA|nr:hypothetical protein I7I52_02681 [Histoplasma capsulatum]QSS69966.1 hypothetical protein I7I50_11443 [Histoplasma capsulatum G186AR]
MQLQLPQLHRRPRMARLLPEAHPNQRSGRLRHAAAPQLARSRLHAPPLRGRRRAPARHLPPVPGPVPHARVVRGGHPAVLGLVAAEPVHRLVPW